MPKTEPTPSLKTLRERTGKTLAEVAAALEVPEATVALWERDASLPTPEQRADLAALLWAPWGPHTDESAEAALYGAVKIEFQGHEVEYPIDRRARGSVLSQISALDVQEVKQAANWLSFCTMDNKLVFANFAAIEQVEVVSDDAEQAVDYQHPAVYAALEDWELEPEPGPGPVIKSICENLIENADKDEDPVRQASYVKAISTSGKVSWHFMLEDDDTLGYYTLELEAGNIIEPNRYLRLLSEGYHRERFANLSKVALLEVPLGSYLRLIAQDQEGEN